MYDFDLNANDLSEAFSLTKSLSRRPGAQGMHSPLQPGSWLARGPESHYAFERNSNLRSERFELRNRVLDDEPDNKWLTNALALGSILRTVQSAVHQDPPILTAH